MTFSMPLRRASMRLPSASGSAVAIAYSARGRRTETGEGVARMLLPIAIGFEKNRRDPSIRGEPGDDVVEQPRSLLTRQRAEVIAAQAGPRGMAAEQERGREHDPAPGIVR